MCRLLIQLISALICLALVASVLGFSTQYRGNTKHPAIPKHCYYEELELAVPLNGTVFPVDVFDFCAQVHCREDYVLMIRHCDRIQLANGCVFTSNDYSLPYPDCCAQLDCDN